MKKIGVISVIILLLFISNMACYKRVHCPGLPTNLDYFPYHDGQTLKYVNSQQDTVNFVIAQVTDNTKSVTCQESPKCPDCKCECGFGKTFSALGDTLQDRIPSIYAHFGVEGGGPKTITSANIKLSFTCFVDDWSKSLFNKNIYKGEKITYGQIDDFFNDTISIENANNEVVKKIVIVKGKGLVSYTTADGEEWKLVE